MSGFSLIRNISNFSSLLRVNPAPVGIYGLPRGGTNFISAWLHYHPNVFCVSERRYDWRKRLLSYWRRHSLFRYHGVQDKKPSNIEHVVFNKVQRFPELWGADVDYPPETKFIFYLRNPVRIHISREAFRSKHDTDRENWSDSRDNFQELLAEVRNVLEVYMELRERYPCLLLSHEYYCSNHGSATEELFRFLGISGDVVTPQSFFKRCGKCGTSLMKKSTENAEMLYCTECKKPIEGFGNFNPLREIDLKDVCSDRWKDRVDIADLMSDLENIAGEDIAAYYRSGDYSRNIIQRP